MTALVQLEAEVGMDLRGAARPLALVRHCDAVAAVIPAGLPLRDRQPQADASRNLAFSAIVLRRDS
jgi:hypothetical protein